MRSSYRLTNLAEDDLRDIWFYIAEDNVDAANRLIDLLTDSFSLLAANPLLGRAREELRPGLRSFPVKRYMILYRPNEKGVEISRVVSGYRDLHTL